LWVFTALAFLRLEFQIARQKNMTIFNFVLFDSIYDFMSIYIKTMPLVLVVWFQSFAAVNTMAQSSGHSKPNVILIMADDMGMETLKSYGGESYYTPRLDELAERGMRFTHCYSTPLCTPSRVQIMTGKYNFRNYVGFGLLDAEQTTFGHLMQSEGYETCVVGKWQLYGNEKQQTLAGGRVGSLPEQVGFNDYCLWQIKDRGNRYKHPTVTSKSGGTETFESAYGPDKFVDFMEDFMTKQVMDDKPFFVYYPMTLVHDPFQPPPGHPLFADYDPSVHPKNDTTWFRDMMTYMDKMVGRIVDKVEDLGAAENTLILFIGDNGTDRDVISRWEGKRIQGQKGYALEAGTHVPMLAYWPGKIMPSTVNPNLIDFTDFLPTIVDVAGSRPARDLVLDGRSFYPQLVGKKRGIRGHVFCHYEPHWGGFEAKTYIHGKRWKLYDDGAFFDFARDPMEENPLEHSELSTEALRAKKRLERDLKKITKK